VLGLVVGKVHGSLARAGKVKGQTPKVEKQEKKKVVRGRAKKSNNIILSSQIWEQKHLEHTMENIWLLKKVIYILKES